MTLNSLLSKLKDALNARDIDAFTDCFHNDYTSEQPAHPARSFQGRDTVYRNWSSNFREMNDFSAVLLNYAIHESTIWAEWEWHGTRQDRTRLDMGGVTIFGVENEKITWGRLYMEPIEVNGMGIESAVQKIMQGKNK